MSVRFSELDGAAIGVWGAGREISSFARQLSQRIPSARIAVAAFDGAPDGDVRSRLRAPDARLVTGSAAVEALASCDVVVRSPGVSIHRAQIRALHAAGVPITTATALWLGERDGRAVLGVTGTKGKSTTASLIAHLARACGRDAHLAGNIGVPAIDLLDCPASDMAVVELSSYQIADLAVGPEVAVITSLFREHTEWHGSEEAYRAEKLRIAGLPGVRVTVFNARDAQLASMLADAQGTVRYGVRDGWDLADGGVAFRGDRVLGAEQLPLPGEHNALNLCGALAALEAFGIAPTLPAALDGFRALPHRLETIAERDGVVWVDDSISTTPESTLAALASFPGRGIVLIAGGQDRGQEHEGLAQALAATGATVIGVPSTGPRLLAAARGAGLPLERTIESRDLEEAVARANELAGDGDVVILSPAGPSYDNYRDFEQRGERFRALVAGVGPRRSPGG